MGKWGSICDDEWDIREASVVCRELGFADVVYETHNSMYGLARCEYTSTLSIIDWAIVVGRSVWSSRG